jgi:hypothetical protein
MTRRPAINTIIAQVFAGLSATPAANQDFSKKN